MAEAKKKRVNLFGEIAGGKKTLKKIVQKERKIEQQFCNTEEEYFKMIKDTHMEVYYEQIRDVTFDSKFVELPKEIAEDIIAGYKSYKQSGKAEASDQLEAFFAKLNEPISELKQKVDGVFLRLSSRSPKDSVIYLDRMDAMFLKELEWVKSHEEEAGETSSDLNQKLHALYRASTYVMSLENAEQGLEMCLKSYRIQGDLERYVKEDDESGEAKDPFNVILREFHLFHVHLEFRGFIYNRKLTSLTQYNHTCYFPTLKKDKEAICDLICAQFELIREKIPNEHYVIDFVLTGETSEEYKMYIIEINPFGEFAGSGLFSWTEDKQVLTGRAAFEFRIIEKEITKLDDLGREWQKFLSKYE